MGPIPDDDFPDAARVAASVDTARFESGCAGRAARAARSERTSAGAAVRRGEASPRPALRRVVREASGCSELFSTTVLGARCPDGVPCLRRHGVHDRLADVLVCHQ